MRLKGIGTAIAVLFAGAVAGQGIAKITGPLGVYHIAKGYTYNNYLSTDSLPIQDQFKMGELSVPDQEEDFGYNFQETVDSCLQWHANRVFGIIQPPSEQGVYNQPADTSLFNPYLQSNHPGMIQGGQRFSKLSELYGPFAGLVLDDWNSDTSITHQVRDALLGKYVDEDGNVCSYCPATTPYNKLFCVIYSNNLISDGLDFMDGISYWHYLTQSCCYTTIDSEINQLRILYPHKEIHIGIYICNSQAGWTDPTSVRYMLSHSINRYDDGDINGISMFGDFNLVMDSMHLPHWDSLALPTLLDSIYFPYLGEGLGKITDCKTGNAVQGAFVRAFCKGPVSGDTLMRSSQMTDATGQYSFGLWAGNRNTDSTLYWLIAERSGYQTDTVLFWMKRSDTTFLPNVSLCPEAKNSSSNNLQLFPNPTNGVFTASLNTADASTGTLEVYNLQGAKVYSAYQQFPYAQVNLSGQAGGVYIVLLRTAERAIKQKGLLVLVH